MGSVPHIYTKGGTLTYFQVMRDRLRRGWFWCVVGLCSAGSVLRAQGSSGEDGAFAQRAREMFDRFQCLLRPGPAAASRLSGGSENLGTGSQKVNRGPPGVGPTHLHKRGHSYLFSGNEGQAPNGMVLVRFWVVLCGTGPARAGKLGGGWGFRAAREGDV